MAILSLLFVGCAAASRTASAVSAQWTIAPSAAAASTPPRLAGAVSADDDVDYSSRIEIEGMKRFGAGSFESHADLQMSLEAHGVDTSAWEQRLTKTCEALFTELELGESVLWYAEDEAVMWREVRVVKVRIQRPGAPHESLVEARQDFADGRKRVRGRPLSEKMLPWEGPLAAAKRGVLEELGPALGRARVASISIDDASLVSWTETREESSSFPSLATRYRLHQVDAVVSGLPCKSFTTLEVCRLSAIAAAAASYNARALRRRHRRLAMQIAPGQVLSASGRPIELPCDLRHVWEWCADEPLDEQQQEAAAHENSGGA